MNHIEIKETLTARFPQSEYTEIIEAVCKEICRYEHIISSETERSVQMRSGQIRKSFVERSLADCDNPEEICRRFLDISAIALLPNLSIKEISNLQSRVTFDVSETIMRLNSYH